MRDSNVARGLLHRGELRLDVGLGLLATLVFRDEDFSDTLGELLRITRVVPGDTQVQNIGVWHQLRRDGIAEGFRRETESELLDDDRPKCATRRTS